MTPIMMEHWCICELSDELLYYIRVDVLGSFTLCKCVSIVIHYLCHCSILNTQCSKVTVTQSALLVCTCSEIQIVTFIHALFTSNINARI